MCCKNISNVTLADNLEIRFSSFLLKSKIQTFLLESYSAEAAINVGIYASRIKTKRWFPFVFRKVCCRFQATGNTSEMYES